MRTQFEPHFSQLDEESLSRVFSCIHTVHSAGSLLTGYVGLEDLVFPSFPCQGETSVLVTFPQDMLSPADGSARWTREERVHEGWLSGFQGELAPGRLVKTPVAGLHPRASDPAGLGWSLRMCISTKFQ